MEQEKNKKENKISNENKSKSSKLKIKTQTNITPPGHDPSKDKVTKGFSNDESTLGGSDTFQPNFPDAQY